MTKTMHAPGETTNHANRRESIREDSRRFVVFFRILIYHDKR